MSHRSLRSSTALALGLALAVTPLPLAAQEVELPACDEDVPFPCLDAEGDLVKTAPESDTQGDSTVHSTGEAPQDGAPPPGEAVEDAPSEDSALPPADLPEPPPTPDPPEAPPAPDAEAPAPEPPAEPPEPEEAPAGQSVDTGEAAQAQPTAAADEAAEPPAPAASAPAAPAPDDAPPPPEPAPEAGDEAALEPAPEAGDEAAPEPAPEAGDEAPDDAPADAPAGDPAPETPAEEPAPETPAEEPATDPEQPGSAEEEPAPEAAPVAESDEPAPGEEAEAAAPPTGDTAPESPDPEGAAPEADAPAEEEGDRVDTPAPAPRDADPARDRAAAPPAAATREDAEPVEETSEAVTEADSRDSTEEFDTRIAGDASARGDDRDGGLSTFERAILLGLGAVAVGSLLDGGGEVVANTGDRIVVERDGEFIVLKNDDAILRQPGSEVRTQTFEDGSTRTTVTRGDGVQVVTLRAPDGSVLRRVRILPDGTRIVIFDDTTESAPVRMSDLPAPPPGAARQLTATDLEALRRALASRNEPGIARTFSLRQIRQFYEVRVLAPEIELDAINFATASAAIEPAEAQELALLGRAMAEIIDEDPDAVFLVEGHTDAVGGAAYNLALSDRRAESVALALVEYFGVPPENLVTQGYGESRLRIDTQDAERANRRAVVRNITPLLR